MGEITLSNAWAWFMGACAAIVAVTKTWDIVKHWGAGDIKAKLEAHTKQLDSDNKRIKSLEEGQIITMQTLLALTQHAINGNNVDGLRDCRDKLQDYLIKR